MRKHGMVFEGDHVIAAVSRGLDSVALLHVLHDLQKNELRLEVAHLQYGIQGDEALGTRGLSSGWQKAWVSPFT